MKLPSIPTRALADVETLWDDYDRLKLRLEQQGEENQELRRRLDDQAARFHALETIVFQLRNGPSDVQFANQAIQVAPSTKEIGVDVGPLSPQLQYMYEDIINPTMHASPERPDSSSTRPPQ